MKFKLHISISDLVRAKKSQKAIKGLQKTYDQSQGNDADKIRVTPFSNGYIGGINITWECKSKKEAREIKASFLENYHKYFLNSEGRLVKFTSLIDVEKYQIYRF